MPVDTSSLIVYGMAIDRNSVYMIDLLHDNRPKVGRHAAEEKANERCRNAGQQNDPGIH